MIFWAYGERVNGQMGRRRRFDFKTTIWESHIRIRLQLFPIVSARAGNI